MRSLIAASVLLTLFGSVAPAHAAATFQVQPSGLSGDVVPFGTAAYQHDDGTNEANIGNNDGGTATQFLWMNRFDVQLADSNPRLAVLEVHVFWDPTPTSGGVVGNAISIEIFGDSNTDPADGAVHRHTENTQIAQVGTSFDVYPMSTPPEFDITLEPSFLVSVVNRWVTTGVTSEVFPAALDQSTSAGNSWAATYASGTVPTPPVIPSDDQFGTIDSFGLPGNWLIRAVVDANVPVELQQFSVD